MKRILLSIILVLTVNIIGAKTFTFKDINNPTAIIIKKGSLFISEKTTLFIYSLDNFKLIKKFGKEGEGPMEFKSNHRGDGIRFTINSNKIYINSETKLSVYSLDGKFINESRVLPKLNLISAGENYISSSLSKSDGGFPKITVSLFNSEFKKIKNLFLSNISSGMGAKIPTPSYNHKYRFYNGKVYISTGTKDINIDVYDTNGKKEFSIVKIPGKKTLTKEYISAVKRHYKTNPKTKNFWRYFQKNLLFLSDFPGIRNFNINNDKIYVQTYKMKSGNTEWIIFGLKGKELRKVWLPSIEVNPISMSPYTIFDNVLYWLTENEEEGWDLHKYNISSF